MLRQFPRVVEQHPAAAGAPGIIPGVMVSGVPVIIVQLVLQVVDVVILGINPFLVHALLIGTSPVSDAVGIPVVGIAQVIALIL